MEIIQNSTQPETCYNHYNSKLSSPPIQSHCCLSGDDYHPEPFHGVFPPSDLPCSDPLPWRKQKYEEESREQKRKERKEGNNYSSEFLLSIYEKVEEKVDQGMKIFRQQVKEAQKVRFQEKINEREEKLFFEYTCEVHNQKDPIGGFLYVACSGLFFHSSRKSKTLCVFIPWFQIESIKKEKVFEEKLWISTEVIFDSIKNSIRYLNSFANHNEKPNQNEHYEKNSSWDTIFIFTKDKKIHCFYKISTLHDPIENYTTHAWNVIDHVWRESWEVDVKELFQ